MGDASIAHTVLLKALILHFFAQTVRRRFGQDMADGSLTRRLPVGAELQPEGAVHFRVWAPGRDTVELVLESGPGEGSRCIGMAPEGNGYFQLTVPGAVAGTLYRYLLDGEGPYPDPASRFQPL
ncbi:MAG TPA: hypothetical protein VHS06_10715, partial [Chloroflexota bacterium]|nr:hypothetical protein [Chloroflexota bacterium]